MSKTKLNILAPLSVSMVVITLGAAFGVLAGQGALFGMVSASVIALITALFAGSRYGVSSPTGPMTAAIAVILGANQSWLATHASNLSATQILNITFIFSAIILLIFTVARVHKLIKFIPNLVISGFVNGIALLIIIAQVKSITLTSDWILMLATMTLALAAGRISKFLNAFFIILAMTLLAHLSGVEFSYLNITNTFANLNLQLPELNLIDLESLKIIIPLAFELALIALLDTVLTSVIMDQKSKKNKAKLGRELSAQSLSMAAMSLFGGLPGAQSTVPSMMMLKEGAHHRYSKLILAGFCILFTVALSGLLSYIPTAVFGGLILKIAIDVADFTSIKSLFNCPWGKRPVRILLLIGTCLSTVLISLNLAVIAFTFFFVFWNQIVPRKYKIPDLNPETEAEGLSDEL